MFLPRLQQESACLYKIYANKEDEQMTNRYNNQVEQRIFRLPQVLSMYNISKPTVYRLIKEGKFPKPLKLAGKRAVGWRKKDLIAWEESLGH